MSGITFLVRGQVVSQSTAEAMLYERPAPKISAVLKRTNDRQNAQVSMGFVVLGYPAEYAQWIADDYSRRIKAHEEQEKGSKHPGTPDEHERHWLAKNKPKRIGRPYSLESAAEVCAELARKAGWLHVRVDEVLRA